MIGNGYRRDMLKLPISLNAEPQHLQETSLSATTHNDCIQSINMINQEQTAHRPVTRRTSIRQSLNLTTMSKAFADVMNKPDKDGSKDAGKSSKKIRDSRRLSIQAKPSRPRTSLGDSRSPSQATMRTATPEYKSNTRRRVSISTARSPSEEQPQHKSESGNSTPRSGILTRAASLRSKKQSITASSLPKYRPKMVTSEQSKPPSPKPVRAGTRRRLSSSDDSGKEERQKSVTPSASSVGNPLPQRAVFQTMNTSPTPPTPTAGAQSSPARPTKAHKSASSMSAVPRSSSLSSGSVGLGPQSSSSSPTLSSTPQASAVKSTRRRSVTQDNNNRPLPSTSHCSESPSSSTRNVRQRPRVNSQGVGNMSHISECIDEDEEELADVELLLAPVANPSAPTPAMPRIQKYRPQKPPALPPKTPSRSLGRQLPIRVNTSGEDAPHFESPQYQAASNAQEFGRGSILSWEQFASEAAHTLGRDELNNLLNDIPAPFHSETTSPASSALDLPSSPCLSTLDSPAGYGSISQVLLPDVTPSPAVHVSQRYNLANSDLGQVDSPVVNLLRLQLAKAENMVQERLMQVQAMEHEIFSLKETHARQMQDTVRHITYLEANERKGEDARVYASSLEEKLKCAEMLREKAVRDTQRRCEDSVRQSLNAERKEKDIVQIGCAAKLALSEWASVKDLAEIELDLLKGDQAVLSVLLTELDQMTRVLRT